MTDIVSSSAPQKSFIRRIPRAIGMGMIRIYQLAISPITGGRCVCRFTPSCSEYTRQAVDKYGLWRGCILGAKRISRCRPGGGFGYDPVP